MSDTSGTTPDPQISAAPEPPAAPASAPAAGGDGQQSVDYSTHPVWGRALEPIPEVLRGPLVETIKASEAETQKAIENARGTGVSAEWRELAAEAQQRGVTVEQLAEAYRGQELIRDLLQNDPDEFLAEMQRNVDSLVASGQITRRQGADAMRGAQAQAEQADDLLTDEQKQLRELQAWKQQQEQRDAQRAEQERQAQAQQQMEQQAEREAQQFFAEFDQQMLAAGFVQQDASGRVVSIIPEETLQMIGETAGQLLDRNERLSHGDAIRQATAHVKRQIEAAGGRLGAPAAPATPVIGSSAAMPAGQPSQQGQPRTMEQREQAALAEVMRLRGSD